MNSRITRLQWISLAALWLLASTSAAANTLVLELNHGMLQPLGIGVSAERAIATGALEHRLGYQRLEFAGVAPQTLRVSASGNALLALTGGELRYHGGLRFHFGGRTVELTDFRLQPDPGSPLTMRLVDGAGTVWLLLDHGHFELTGSSRRFELRHANLGLSRRFAELLGQPELEGQIIGTAHLGASVTILSADAGAAVRGVAACEVPAWPTAPGVDADVVLTGLGNGLRGAQAMRCSGCDGAGAGTLVIATDATLRNDGTADVPWFRQFSAPQAPYGNDQHPFLVWNLYRLDRDGRLEQIGVSSVKHAFFSTNQGCPCAGGNVLWTGCSDTYSASTNDRNEYLAPRAEVLPLTGQWGRCRSLFDPNCIGEQTATSTGGFANRMQVLESDLAAASNPGARWFIEAWYVVRDDVDPFNTMGWREVAPSWTGSIWTFPAIGDMQPGPVVAAWPQWTVDAIATDNTVVESQAGRITLSVAVSTAAAGRFRYDYVVMNHEVALAETLGSEPDLDIVESSGLSGFAIALRPDTVIAATESARADRTTGKDWPGSRNGDLLEWTDPGETTLGWGRAFRFSVVASGQPESGAARLAASAGEPLTLELTTLVPGTDALFVDDFEAVD